MISETSEGKIKVVFEGRDEIESLRLSFNEYIDWFGLEGTMSDFDTDIVRTSCMRSELPCIVRDLDKLIEPLSHFAEYHERAVDKRLDTWFPKSRVKAAGYVYRLGHIANELAAGLLDINTDDIDDRQIRPTLK